MDSVTIFKRPSVQQLVLFKPVGQYATNQYYYCQAGKQLWNMAHDQPSQSATLTRKYRNLAPQPRVRENVHNIRCTVYFNHQGLNMKIDGPGPEFELYVIHANKIALLILGKNKMQVWNKDTEEVHNACIFELVFDDPLYAHKIKSLCIISNGQTGEADFDADLKAIFNKYTTPGVQIEELPNPDVGINAGAAAGRPPQDVLALANGFQNEQPAVGNNDVVREAVVVVGRNQRTPQGRGRRPSRRSVVEGSEIGSGPTPGEGRVTRSRSRNSSI